MNRIVRHADARLKFLPAILLSLAAALTCTEGFAQAVARAQGKPAGELPRRGFAGVQVGPVSEEVRARLKLTAAQGLLVRGVVAGSAAAEAGLAEGDVILEAAGKPLEGAEEYVATVQRMSAGDKLPLTILREGRRLSLTLTLKPRPFESRPDLDVLYRSVETAAGRRRVIVTRPKGQGRFPAVLLVGGIGCYSLDGLDPEGAYGRILYGLTLKGFATMRVEKTGTGDSEGPPCASPQADLRQEVAGYVAGLRALKSYDFVDAGRVFIFGHSIGGIVGPLVAAEEPVRGLVAAETIGTDWFEYELANFRRQTLLAGTPYDETERRARQARACKQRMLVGKEAPEQILKDAPTCSEHLESPAPYTYMQQLADLNLAEVWKKVDARVLIIYGTSDFLTSAAEHEYLRDMLNSFRPGSAAYVRIEGMGHGFERAASQREYFESRGGGARPEFHTQVFDETLRWLTAAAGAP
ncbi:MAG: alpha/beta fold hydrolase [Acidobacteria bacterium]|nr:alpha/beta fold hydrolase [Acidobacteriota bacterium]